MTPRRIVLATRNAHKVLELKRILSSAGLPDVELVGLDAYPDLPDVAETEDSFEGNATLKARGGGHRYRSHRRRRRLRPDR